MIFQSRIFRILLPLLGLNLTASVANANVILPTIFAFSPTLVLGLPVFFGMFAVVVSVETLVLVRFYKQRWAETLKLVLKANILSTIVGVGIMAHPFEIFALIAIFFVILRLAKTQLGWTAAARVSVALLAVSAVIAVLVPCQTIPGTVIQFYAAILVAFGLSVLFEAFTVARVSLNGRQALRRSVAMNCASYAVLGIAMLIAGLGSGRFVATEWHIHNLTRRAGSLAERDALPARLEELYQWENSGNRRRASGSQGGFVPFTELYMVATWASEGDTTRAKELYQLVEKYKVGTRKLDDRFWKGTEAAIRESETADSSLTLKQRVMTKFWSN